MKILDKLLIKFTFVFFIMLSFNTNAQKIIESNDLNTFSSIESSEAKLQSGWPVNGCKVFNVTLTTGIGIEIAFEVNHCCVQGVCAAESMWNLFNRSKQIKEDPKAIKEVLILKSSKVKLGHYMVNIKKGTYKLNKLGQLENLVYEGVAINK